MLFVTSADRPFTETERAFLETIRDWGKKIVIVVNKVDIFEREAELDEVLAFVRDVGAAACSGIAPDVFPVSARLAHARQAGRAGAVGGQPVRSARALHPRHRSTRAAASA